MKRGTPGESSAEETEDRRVICRSAAPDVGIGKRYIQNEKDKSCSSKDEEPKGNELEDGETGGTGSDVTEVELQKEEG